MTSTWPALNYPDWSATCDTLHAHTQVLGKLAAVLAAPEPQFQHTALRLTARGWETAPLPAPDRSGALVVGLDLHDHVAFVEHSAGSRQRVALAPDRPVGEVTSDLLAAISSLAGPVAIDPTPQEVSWTRAARPGREHASYDADAVSSTSRGRPRSRSCSPSSAPPSAAGGRRSTRGGARSTWR